MTADESELIPAATVVLLRDGPETGELEVLMLRRNSKIAFGGAWVFPGGRVDDEDHGDRDGDRDGLADGDGLAAARRAAAREVGEETGLVISADQLETWSLWVPPELSAIPARGPRRRFSTWFFATPAPDGAVVVDHGEIHEDRWYRPADALVAHRAREIELVPPTWVTLTQLSGHGTVDAAMGWAAASRPEEYRTRPIAREPLTLAWAGDVAYDGGDVNDAGPRHRLVLLADGWRYERT